MVERVDGSTEQFSCLRCTHADVQECISDKDRALAFRLATGWEVQGRWQAYKYCVFKHIIQEFETPRSKGGL